MNFLEIKHQMELQNIIFTEKITEENLAEIEYLYNITFPKSLVEFYKLGIPFGGKFADFPNWFDFSNCNVESIRKRLDFPMKSLKNDVINGFWISLWGERPSSVTCVEKIFTELSFNAPKLIPVYGHRYIPMLCMVENPPLLSIAGQDIVYYGEDLLDYLNREFLGRSGRVCINCDVPFWEDIARSNTSNHFKNVDNVILETALKNIQSDKINQTIVVQTCKGNLYHSDIDSTMSYQDGEDLLLSELKLNNDTAVEKILCMQSNNLISLPSIRLRKRLCEINHNNINASILIQGNKCFNTISIENSFSKNSYTN